MVKKEEHVKEETETRVLEEKIAHEEYKAECLEKTFEEREVDDEFAEAEAESSNEVNEVHVEAKKKITQSRNKLKKNIQQMKLKSKTKNQDLSNKLKQIRSKMSKEIMLANKNGHIESCRKGRKNSDFRETYCNENFVDDWTRNSDCKGEEFCYVCCETEFGAMFVTQRDNCYKMCDYKPKVPVVPAAVVNALSIRKDIAKPSVDEHDDGNGQWIWAPVEQTKN